MYSMSLAVCAALVTARRTKRLEVCCSVQEGWCVGVCDHVRVTKACQWCVARTTPQRV